MCGFAGIIQDNFNSGDIVKEMGNTISHRGPDFTGYYFDDHAGFVHNRLSLVDISSNGNQPFVNDQYVLLFNGEIYNHIELRNTHLKNQVFLSTSDTETLFWMLCHYGVKKTSTLIKGMFAFAWYDKISADLFLVRDRIGIKPLFYMKQNDCFCFSSELKSLVLHHHIEVNSMLVLSAALGELEYSRTNTAFQGVKQLEPGSILHYKLNGTCQVEAFFQIQDLVDEHYYAELHSCPYTELELQFDRHIDKSVKSMLMSDVGMGSFISGGLDSSLITSIAHGYQSIKMYTANVLGKHSEYDACRTVANHLHADLQAYDYEPEYYIRDLVDTTWHYESPITVHSNAMPFSGVAKLARQTGTKAVLTGEGADELFLGYPRLLTRKWDGFLKLPYTFVNKLYSFIPGLSKYLNIKKVNHSNDLLYLPYIYERKGYNRIYQDSFSFAKSKKLIADHALSLEMLGRGLHSLLWRNDRIGMMHSIESRFPFLDEDLVKFAVNLPISAKIGNTYALHNIKHPFLIDKRIVRSVSEKYIPKNISYNIKKGFITTGHGNIHLKKGFFKNGFLQNTLKIDGGRFEILESSLDNILLSKLAQVEIWGRLFVFKEKKEDVRSLVTNYMALK